jgi:hypothetical protein
MKIIRKEISTASNKPWHYKTSLLLLFFKKYNNWLQKYIIESILKHGFLISRYHFSILLLNIYKKNIFFMSFLPLYIYIYIYIYIKV